MQGLPGPALAAKVLACFRDSISDSAMRLVRSMVLAKAAFSSPRGSGGGDASSSISGSPSARSSCSGLGDCTTEELCKLLSAEMVQPCLTKLLEILFELLCSYSRMLQWHRAGIEQQQAAAAAAAAALKSHCEATSSSGGASSETTSQPGITGSAVPAAPSQAELDQVQAATSSMLEAVAGGLASSRMDIIEVAAARVCELLAVAKKCKGEDFMKVRGTLVYCSSSNAPATVCTVCSDVVAKNSRFPDPQATLSCTAAHQVLEGCLHFVSIAEAFTGCSLPLRATVLSSLAACVDSYQKANMEALRMSLALEDWQPLNARSSAGGISNPSSSSSSSSIDTNGLRQQLSNSPYLLPAHGQSGCVADFDVWMQAGNPFTAKARTRAVGGEPHHALCRCVDGFGETTSNDGTLPHNSLLVLQVQLATVQPTFCDVCMSVLQGEPPACQLVLFLLSALCYMAKAARCGMLCVQGALWCKLHVASLYSLLTKPQAHPQQQLAEWQPRAACWCCAA